MAELISVACRKCNKGWWKKALPRCPKCKGELVVTGQVEIIDLKEQQP